MEIVRVVDLSRIIDSETQVYPGDPVPHIEQHSTIARDGFNLMSVSMGSQSGTHVDAPFHFDESTLTIDEVPLERFVGRGTIVDCRGVGAREAVTYESVASQIDDVAPGDIIITGTPSGVGFARKPPVFMKGGDTCEIDIEKIGVLRNTIVDEA